MPARDSAGPAPVPAVELTRLGQELGGTAGADLSRIEVSCHLADPVLDATGDLFQLASPEDPLLLGDTAGPALGVRVDRADLDRVPTHLPDLVPHDRRVDPHLDPGETSAVPGKDQLVSVGELEGLEAETGQGGLDVQSQSRTVTGVVGIVFHEVLSLCGQYTITQRGCTGQTTTRSRVVT